LPDVIEARRQALFNIIQKQTEINKTSSSNGHNNNDNNSISSNNNHENNSNSMIINDPVCCSLVHFENDLEKLEEKSNTIKQSKVSEEPAITNTKCSIDKEIE
jgi:hypothetical protein